MQKNKLPTTMLRYVYALFKFSGEYYVSSPPPPAFDLEWILPVLLMSSSQVNKTSNYYYKQSKHLGYNKNNENYSEKNCNASAENFSKFYRIQKIYLDQNV